MDLADELAEAGVTRRTPLVAVVTAGGLGLAWPGGSRAVPGDAAWAVRTVERIEPRWTWWSAQQTAPVLVAAGLRLRACWDLGAVGRLLHGLARDDPAAVWAAAYDLPEPPAPQRGGSDLFDLDAEDGEPVRADGQLSREWLGGAWSTDLGAARRWAELGSTLQQRQEQALAELPDPRPAPYGRSLPVLTAYAESAAALLAVELGAGGLPLDGGVARELLTAAVGPRPLDEVDAGAQREARDRGVHQHFPGGDVDLRHPAQVRELLGRIGLDLPDTRSWRLEPHAATSPAVAALLAWRRAERTATTYGWSWLEAHVGRDGRLRGRWQAADGAAGRMTASAGLHNLPAELRPAVRAGEGHLLVRADLGQVEPRVLAVVSGDPALARAAGEQDLYAPVAARLGCDRPTAKVAVLAAMYGQTSGTAGAALREMDRAYPVAMAHLRAAERVGQHGGTLRTYGGRLLRLGAAEPGEPLGEHVAAAPGAGRFARNAVVQGAAAELFKAWTATVRDGLLELEGEVVLCLHDELLVRVPAGRAPAAADLLEAALQATASWWAAGSSVRFVAEIGTGPSWAQAR